MSWTLDLIKRLRRRFGRKPRYPVLYNVNRGDEAAIRKRALLVYLTKPFLLPADTPEFHRHQNFMQCKQIAELLGEFGYIVDVAEVRDQTFRPKRDYDLVLKDRVNLRHFTPARGGTRRWLLATTMNHRVHNRNVRRRLAMLAQRRGRGLPAQRLAAEQMPFAVEADAIIGFGNDYTVATWGEDSKARRYPFNNYGFPGTRFIFEDKDFLSARQNFLFFASRSQVQKGLDLLLEIFPRLPHLNLYICSGFEREADFCECYHKELFETPNIHPVGWIDATGSEFHDLAARCAYVIHPTCSEGQPGSVVQCMHAGMIPLVTREAGLDTEDFGITFANDSIEEIEKVIIELAGLPETWHREHSLKTRAAAEEKFSIDEFLRRWREILTEVLADGH